MSKLGVLLFALSNPISPTDLQKREKAELRSWISSYRDSSCTASVKDYYDSCTKSNGHFLIIDLDFNNGNRVKFTCIDSDIPNLGSLYENNLMVPDNPQHYNRLNFSEICNDNGLVLHHNFVN